MGPSQRLRLMPMLMLSTDTTDMLHMPMVDTELMAMATHTDMVTMERDLLMLSQRPRLMLLLYGAYGYAGYAGYPYALGGYRAYGYPYTYGYYGKRSADAEPEADADALYGYYGYRPYGYGYRAYG